MICYILSGSAASGGAQGSEAFPSFYPCLCFKGSDISAGLGTCFQEYERAVIFQLGWLLSGGSRGPGVSSISLSLSLFSGIREGGDIPAGSAAVWWSPGSGSLLHHSLCGHLRENRHEGPEF